MKTPWDQRENNLDFLRLALSVLVIFSHSYPLGTGSETMEPVSRWTHGQMTAGAISVDLFFIMSGFLITASAIRSKGLKDYVKKRVTRIYPGFFVAALLGITVVARIGHASLLSGWHRVGDFLLQTLRLREFTYSNVFLNNPYPHAINGSMWSIQYEFWCYLGIAALLVTGMLRRRALPGLLLLFSVALSVAFLVKGWILGGKFLGVLLGSPQLWARLLPYYLAGTVFYLYRDTIRYSHLMAVLSVGLLVAACFFPIGWALLFPFTGAYLVFYLAFAAWLPLQRVGRFGDFSYGTYLYAYPIQQILMQWTGHTVSPWVLFLQAAPLTLLAAVLSWYGVERHFLRPGRRKETMAHALEQTPSH